MKRYVTVTSRQQFWKDRRRTAELRFDAFDGLVCAQRTYLKVTYKVLQRACPSTSFGVSIACQSPPGLCHPCKTLDRRYVPF